jgi:hypothetical protein
MRQPRPINLAEKSRSEYQAYLVRLSREGRRCRDTSLHSTSRERIYHFATIEALFGFLDACLMDEDARAEPKSGPPPQEP